MLDSSKFPLFHEKYSSFFFLFFVLITLAVKFTIITLYGSAVPYWDQWDSEAAFLYKPYIEGNLSFTDLIAPHNEHRIFMTRILAIMLFEINDGWNPLLQMYVNAVIHITTLCFIIFLLARAIGKQYTSALFLFATVLFIFPYAWENTLAGFQSQFYFVLFFAVLTIWLLINHEALSLRWWLGILAATAAYFSLASGIFAIAAVIAVMIMQYIMGARRHSKQLIGIVILASLFLVGYAYIPVVAHHAQFKAQSFLDFYEAMFRILSWPTTLEGLLLYLPSLVFVFIVLFKKLSLNNKQWFLLAIIVWCFGQYLSLAYGRAAFPLSSRYLDLIAIGLLANFAVLLSLFHSNHVFMRWQKWRAVFIPIWLAIIILGLSDRADVMYEEIQIKKTQGIEQEKNVRAYLCTSDASHIENKASFDIPYPSSIRLKMLLDDDQIKKILPSNLSACASTS